VSSLAGKVVIVTGATGAIGSVTSEMFAEEGSKVVLAARNTAAAEGIAARIRSKGGAAKAIEFNLAEETSIVAMIEKTVKEFGGLDVLVNNAAYLDSVNDGRDGDIESTDVEVWDRTYHANARGTMLSCKYALRMMPRHAGASIINVVSDQALSGSLVKLAYGSSKAAVIQMTRAIDTSHARQGIRCNSVAPGLTLTPITRAVVPAPIREYIEGETLTPDLGEPADVAHMIVFLASSAAKHITGQNIVIDGGMSAHNSGFAKMYELMAPRK